MAKTVGSYLLIERIGRGSMGDVYRAMRSGSDDVFAVKVLRGDIADDPEIVGRFLQERSVLILLDDPSLVRVHDLVVEGGSAAIVMDLIDGGDLRRYLEARSQLTINDAIAKMAVVYNALSIVHSAGVLHRDIKPENILLGSAGSAHLSDFGIARLVERPRMTQTFSILGTPTYMAPEIGSGAEITPACDVYSAGVVLYELIIGRPPFEASNPMAMMRLHSEVPPKYPPDFPDTLREFLNGVLAKDASRRPDAATASAQLTAMLASNQFEGVIVAAPGPGVAETIMTSRPPQGAPVNGVDATVMHSHDSANHMVAALPLGIDGGGNVAGAPGNETNAGIKKVGIVVGTALLVIAGSAAAFGLTHHHRPSHKPSDASPNTQTVSATVTTTHTTTSTSPPSKHPTITKHHAKGPSKVLVIKVATKKSTKHHGGVHVPIPPQAPQDIAVTATNGDVTVNWSPPKAGAVIEKYVVTSNPNSAGCTTTTTTCTVTGLSNGTAYSFVVTAVATSGKEIAAPSTSDVTPFSSPGAVSDLQSSLTGATAATISWAAPNDNGSPITGYTITGLPSNCAVNGTSCTASGLSAATTYTVCVVASNAAGSGPQSSCTSITTAGPPLAPSGVTDSNVTTTSAVISWSAPNDGGSPITSYTVTGVPGCDPGSSTSCTTSGLTSGSSYNVCVSAVNALGSGPQSCTGGFSTTTTTPTTSPPPAPSYYEVSNPSGPTHTWSNYSDAGGTEGATIGDGTTVQVSCRVQGLSAGGTTWWYRIASSPWSNSFYASCSAFYNTGTNTSGPFENGIDYDPNVPTC
jgi:serine/threonine protein kinase